MRREPLVSIGLPVYNGAEYLQEAIGCVQAQTYENWRLIICDNASVDDTYRIGRKFAEADARISVYRHPKNLGALPNFNSTFNASRGEYFKWITHDDLFGPAFLRDAVQVLQDDRAAILAFPQLEHVDRHGGHVRFQSTDLSVTGRSPFERVMAYLTLARTTTDIFWAQFGVIRREALLQTRLMDSYSGADQVLLLALCLVGDLRQFPVTGFSRREHPTASTMRRNWTARQRASFACAGDTRRLVFPYWRLIAEYMRTLNTDLLSTRERWHSRVEVLRRFRPQWKQIATELVRSPCEEIAAHFASRSQSISRRTLETSVLSEAKDGASLERHIDRESTEHE